MVRTCTYIEIVVHTSFIAVYISEETLLLFNKLIAYLSMTCNFRVGLSLNFNPRISYVIKLTCMGT